MLRETGRSIGHFKDASRKKGKAVVNFSKRAASPTLIIAGTVGLVGGVGFLASHLREDREAERSIGEHVEQTYPRIISDEQYETAKLVVHFGQNTDGNIPEHIQRYKKQIEQEDTRSQDAAQLKKQLTDTYEATRLGHRKKIAGAVGALSLAAFLAPIVRKKIADKHRINANSPESRES